MLKVKQYTSTPFIIYRRKDGVGKVYDSRRTLEAAKAMMARWKAKQPEAEWSIYYNGLPINA